MKRLRVLHLASFTGNIGDNANHYGSGKWFKSIDGLEFHFTRLEIREFYWRNKKFDIEFAELCNQFDLILIGGGNYFELWVESSSTGTSIDLSDELLDMIKTPIVFYSLGVDAGQGYSDSNKHKFLKFVQRLMKTPERYFLSVRNDGSYSTLCNIFGEEIANYFTRIPDGGFFIDHDLFSGQAKFESKLIGVNLAGDMLEVRYPEHKTTEVLKEFADTIVIWGKMHPEYKFVFFNHILRDISITEQVFKFLPDEFYRKRVILAPSFNGDEGMRYVFSIYAQCDLVIGNRFHSNVCSIALNIPSIGLINYSQIRFLYEELGMSDRTVDISSPGFGSMLLNLVNVSISHSESVKSRYIQVNDQVNTVMSQGFGLLVNWINKNQLI